ncbi:MAG: MBL fold metallo-hydrolase [Gemmatirosa sp.]
MTAPDTAPDAASLRASRHAPARSTAAHHRPDGGFRNPWPGGTPTGIGGLLRWMLVERRGGSGPVVDTERVAAAYPPVVPTFASPRAAAGAVAATWIGHSAFLLQIGGWNVLVDPVFGDRVSPVTFAGPRRYTPPGVALDALPPIDLVLHSHDHYDHLDAPSVQALAQRHPSAAWIAPLGVARTLAAYGVAATHEMDWWDTRDVGPLRVGCMPAQHFSGRGLADRNRSLWCGWTLHARGDVDAAPPAPGIFYSGDTGLHPEFGAIARARGPFALALLPIGAYAPRWFMRPVHCDPDDAVTAYGAVAAAQAERHPTLPPPTFGGMHFGTFVLTDEPIDEPPTRTRAAWTRAGHDPARLWVPRHGETWKAG